MIKASELLHGDVLLYDYKGRENFFTRSIRFITGNKYIHSGIVIKWCNKMYVFEQLNIRVTVKINEYKVHPNETILCMRPKFKVKKIGFSELMLPKTYGYISIFDCLVNHAIGRVTFGKWKYRPVFKRLLRTKTIICSALNAEVLDLKNHVDWCTYHEVVEPDDYYNNSQDFMNMGPIDWSA